MKKRFRITCASFSLLFIGLVIFQLTHGSIHLTWSEIGQVLTGHGSAQADLVLLQFRLPQIALSLIRAFYN